MNIADEFRANYGDGDTLFTNLEYLNPDSIKDTNTDEKNQEKTWIFKDNSSITLSIPPENQTNLLSSTVEEDEGLINLPTLEESSETTSFSIDNKEGVYAESHFSPESFFLGADSLNEMLVKAREATILFYDNGRAGMEYSSYDYEKKVYSFVSTPDSISRMNEIFMSIANDLLYGEKEIMTSKGPKKQKGIAKLLKKHSLDKVSKIISQGGEEFIPSPFLLSVNILNSFIEYTSTNKKIL